MLYGSVGEVETEVRILLVEVAETPNFMLSTGCDLPFETPEVNIEAFMRTARVFERERLL